MKEHFLKEGPQTKISNKIKKIAKSLKSSDDEKTIKNIIEWIHKNLLQKFPTDEAHFRKRTADQIIESGYRTGCGDVTVVFISLCRAAGIPASYIESINIKSLTKKEVEKIDLNFLWSRHGGHVFSRVLINGRWIYVDPSSGKINFKVEIFGKERRDKYVIVDEGLDSWNLGVGDKESWKNKLKTKWIKKIKW
jgi:hypothetical protein